MKCVARGLANPKDCWLRQDCRYWNRTLERCCYEERIQAERETAIVKNGKTAIRAKLRAVEPAPSIHPRWDEYIKRRAECMAELGRK